MAVPSGTWNVISNLHAATLNLTLGARLNFPGTIYEVTGTITESTTPLATYPIDGTWDILQKKLTFSYGFEALVQLRLIHIAFTYVGYLFEADSQRMFMQLPGPTSGGNYILAGTYDHSWSAVGNLPQAWVARLSQG